MNLFGTFDFTLWWCLWCEYLWCEYARCSGVSGVSCVCVRDVNSDVVMRNGVCDVSSVIGCAMCAICDDVIVRAAVAIGNFFVAESVAISHVYFLSEKIQLFLFANHLLCVKVKITVIVSNS